MTLMSPIHPYARPLAADLMPSRNDKLPASVPPEHSPPLPSTGTVDDDDEPEDEHEGENEAPDHEKRDDTELPEEFERNDTDRNESGG